MDTLEKLESLIGSKSSDYNKGVQDCINIIKGTDGKAMRKFIGLLGDEDFREAFKGNKLIGYLRKNYIVVKIKLSEPKF